ncbi:DUF1571 domain-containing protein [Mariniblastus sp.]|nr:DUF1571 domain-containing protein [Mariniblastus sp.]
MEDHMRRINPAFLPLFAVSSCVAALLMPVCCLGQDEASTAGKKTTEPVFRVSKLSDASRSNVEKELLKTKPVGDSIKAEAIADANNSGHSLDRAIDMAYDSLATMRSGVQDYTAIMVKREQIGGVVGEPEYMKLKVRCPRETASEKQSFGVYMKFLRPKAFAGREVIWVDGVNQNRMCVHEGRGLMAMREFNLDPTGWVAMKGNRYPVYDAGIENLIIKLIEKAERDRNAGPCTATYREGAQINKRSCTLIELVHNEKKAPYEFHKAQVFIDNELNLPVRYAAYDWPASPGGTPVLMEEYTYVNVDVNVGLTDTDFDPSNPQYHYPNR